MCRAAGHFTQNKRLWDAGHTVSLEVHPRLFGAVMLPTCELHKRKFQIDLVDANSLVMVTLRQATSPCATARCGHFPRGNRGVSAASQISS